MSYRAPINDMTFLLKNVVDYNLLENTSYFEDTSLETTVAILNEAAKMAEMELNPLQSVGDQQPAFLENGVVRTAPGFSDGYKAIADGGWIGVAANSKYGGMGLPLTIQNCVNEMLNSSCLSLALNPLMTQGQIEALEHHASEEIKTLYLPKLITGEWSGTMNLTEPQAGSDVGALTTKAIKNDDNTYAISGQKIYISWGDNDFTNNVCHLVLARLPDGVQGTKGISLFLVPKFLPHHDGSIGKKNNLNVVSLEHKVGLHGSPTAVMEYDQATGWLIGKEHQGMKAMFTMMNNARLGVGAEGLGTAEAAFQKALTFAAGRKQGKTLTNETGTIIDHADVRRMLMIMKSKTYASRAICLATAVAIDMSNASQEEFWISRAALLTPMAKSFGTETGIEVSNLGIQVHGGMGFVEETGAAQYWRDVRVTSIYEGTNGIQAIDLVSRKLMDGGDAAFNLLNEIQELITSDCNNITGLNEDLKSAADILTKATQWMINCEDLNERFAGATSYLEAFALVLGGYYHLKGALAEDQSDKQIKLAKFYLSHVLPQASQLCKTATVGSDAIYGLSVDELSMA
ncbi:MAG: acyl-CoA dehydrogenase [Paracoccaceae bacterium]|jgi:alkylation response protein AidB-like acyl-CoA dehydrogenase|nr:acyl-CoA dehydrogenase [Paracoccaceae bacterium]